MRSRRIFERNENPQPYKWKASGKQLEKIHRARQALAEAVS